MLQSLIVIMNKIMRSASMLLLFFTLNIYGFQGDGLPPPPTPEPSGPPIPPGLPIDDHIILLLIIGLAYGSYKLFRFLKKHQDLKS